MGALGVKSRWRLIGFVVLAISAALLWSLSDSGDNGAPPEREGVASLVHRPGNVSPDAIDRSDGDAEAGDGRTRADATELVQDGRSDSDQAADGQTSQLDDPIARVRRQEHDALAPLIPGLSRPALVSVWMGETDIASQLVQADGPPRIEVRVFGDSDLEPLVGARVSLYQGRDVQVVGVTGADGRVIIRSPEPGEYVVRIEADDHVPLVDDGIVVEAGQSRLIEGRMELGIPVLGTVVREEDGTPIEGASVRILWWRSDGILEPYDEDEIGGWRLTDSSGRFRFDAVPPESRASFEIDAPGRGRLTEEVRVGSAANYVGRYALPVGADLRGVVRLPNGEPAPGATVILFDTSWWRDQWRDAIEGADPNDDEWLDAFLLDEFFSVEEPSPDATLHAWTDRAGAYRVRGLHDGASYAIFAISKHQGCSLARSGIVARVDEATAVPDLLLRDFGRLVLRVVDGKGDALTGATIRGAFPLRGEPEEVAGGEYVLDRADPVVHAGTVRMADGRHTKFEAKVLSGTTTDVRVVVGDGHALSGVVVDSSGDPVSGAEVSLYGVGDRKATRSFGIVTRTGNDGRFAVRGMAEGKYWGTVTCDGFVDAALPPLSMPAPAQRIVLRRGGAVRLDLRVPAGGVAPTSVTLFELQPMEMAGQARRFWWPHEVLDFGDGAHEFTDLRVGPMRLAFDVPPYRAVIRDVDIGTDGAVDLGPTELSPMLVFRGRLVDESGEPIAGAGYQCVDTLLRPRVGGDDPFTRVGADGRFRIDYAEPGRGILWVAAEGRASTAVVIDVGADLPEVDVTVPRGVLIEGVALDRDGAPLVSHAVELRPVVEPAANLDVRRGALQVLRTDTDGRFKHRFAPGTYEFHRTSWWAEVGTVQIVAGDELIIHDPR